jgi:hypothetical protein
MHIEQYSDFKVSLEGSNMWAVKHEITIVFKNMLLITEKISELNFTGIYASA